MNSFRHKSTNYRILSGLIRIWENGMVTSSLSVILIYENRREVTFDIENETAYHSQPFKRIGLHHMHFCVVGMVIHDCFWALGFLLACTF